MNKGEFAGTGKVFAFSFTQHYRSKSTIVSLVIFFLMAAASLPLFSLLAPDDSSLPELSSQWEPEEETEEDYFRPAHIFVDDRTDLGAADTLAEEYADSVLTAVSEKPSEGGPADVYLLIGADLAITVSDFSDSIVPMATMGDIGYAVSVALEEKAAEKAGISPEILHEVYEGYSAITVREDDLNEAGEEEEFSEMNFGVAYGYAALVMMFSLLSASYIVRALVEEKSSKLMETLLLSVKPLALIVGKILAVLCWLICGIAVMAVGFGCSVGITALIHLFGHGPELGAVAQQFAGSGIGGMVTGANGAVIPAALFSLLLAYATFSLLGGFFGSGCSNLEDAGGANAGAVFLAMVCYFIAVMQAVVPSHTLAVIVSLVPVLSCFCGPVNYMSGNVEFWVLLVSWVLQLGTIAVLARMTGNVFRNLVMYQGNRVKLGKLLRYSREGKGGARA